MYDMSVCVQEFGQASLYTDGILFLHTHLTTSLYLIQCFVHGSANSVPPVFSVCDSMIPSVICSVGFLIPLFIFSYIAFFGPLSITLIEVLGFSQTSVQFLCSVQVAPDRHVLYNQNKKISLEKKKNGTQELRESRIEEPHTHLNLRTQTEV